MKKTIKSAVVLALSTLVLQTAMAQKGLQANLSYNIATPLAPSFRNYVSKTSFGSFQASFLYGISEQIRLGVQMSFTDYNHHRGMGNTNRLKTLPILVKGEYSFLPKARIQPYVGLGGGVNIIDYDQIKAGVKKQDQFTKSAFTADAGAFYPFTAKGRFGIRLSTSYDLLAFRRENIKDLNCWNFQLGVSIPLTKG